MPKIVFFGFNNTLTRIDTTPCYYINSMGIPQFNRRPTEDSYTNGKKDSQSYAKTGIEQAFKHDASQISAIITRDFDPDYIAGFIAGILGKELHRIGKPGSYASRLTQIAEYQVEGEDIPLFISHHIYAPSFHYHEIWGNSWNYNKNHQIENLYQELLIKGLVCPMDKIDFYDSVFRNLNMAIGKYPFINSHHVLRDNTFRAEPIESLHKHLTIEQAVTTCHETISQTNPDTPAYSQVAVPFCTSLLTSLSMFAYRGISVTAGEMGTAAAAGLILGVVGIASTDGKCTIS